VLKKRETLVSLPQLITAEILTLAPAIMIKAPITRDPAVPAIANKMFQGLATAGPTKSERAHLTNMTNSNKKAQLNNLIN